MCSSDLVAKERGESGQIEVQIFYPKEGVQREIPEKSRLEEKRVEKYALTLKEMQREEFEAKPEERKCASCPYLFLCPS